MKCQNIVGKNVTRSPLSAIYAQNPFHVSNLIAHGFVSIPSHAFITDEDIGKAVPSILGSGAVLNVVQVLFSHSNTNQVKGSGIQLTLNLFSSCEVCWVHCLVPSFNDLP